MKNITKSVGSVGKVAKVGKVVKSNAVQDNQDKQNNAEKSLTTEYVNRLNEGAQYKLNGWLKQGEIIAEYIGKLLPQPKTMDEAYKKLASHPSSVHKVAQLRNFYECRELFLEFGGDCPNLRMTFYIAVMSKKLTFHKRKELLERAKNEDLTVAQIKELVQTEIGRKPLPTEKGLLTIEQYFNRFEKRCSKLFNDLVGLQKRSVTEPVTTEQWATIQERVNDLADYIERNKPAISETINEIAVQEVQEVQEVQQEKEIQKTQKTKETKFAQAA
jgi:hypothetical protein